MERGCADRLASTSIIVLSVPSISFFISFAITSVFPWYMSAIFSLAPFLVMQSVVDNELLERNAINASLGDRLESPYWFGFHFGITLWIVYAWVTRLRQYDIPNNPAMHTAFLLLSAVFVFTFLFTVFCDPGKCATQTKDLKQMIGGLVRENHLNAEDFCIKCMCVKPPHTEHCFVCKKCITYPYGMIAHSKASLNCIGVKNYKYFLVLILSLFAGIIVFHYLVWTAFPTIR